MAGGLTHQQRVQWKDEEDSGNYHVTSINAHSETIKALSFTPTGNMLVSASLDKTLKVFDVDKKVFLRTLVGHSDSVWSVAISPDGNTVASGAGGGFDYTVRFWDINTGKMLNLLKHNGIVGAVAFSSNGKFFASAGWDEIVLWDFPTGKKLRQFPWSSKYGSVNSLDFYPEDKILVSGHDEGDFKLWDVNTGKLIESVLTHAEPIKSLKLNPDSNTLATASSDGTVKIWNMETRKLLWTLKGHSPSVDCIAINVDGTTLVSASYDKTVKVWNTSNGTLQETLTKHTHPVTAVAFSHNGDMFASADESGQILLWNK